MLRPPTTWLCCWVLAQACTQSSFGRTEPRTAPAAEASMTSLDITDEHFVGPPLHQGKVTLVGSDGLAHEVTVEVAADSASRTRGLMWRRSLLDGQGMLFLFPKQEIQAFWMRNTLIPLDMIFIGSDLRVVGVVEHAEPHSLASRSVGKPSRYVLEVPAGWALRSGIWAGAHVKFEGIHLDQIRP